MGDRCMRGVVAFLGMLVVSAQAFGAVWTNTGPDGGAVARVSVAPSAPATVFAGALLSVFKSLDAGASWSRLAHPVGALLTGEVAVDPTDPNTIYVAGAGPKVWKSTDGGATFVGTPLGMTPSGSIAIDPLDGSHLVAGGFGSIAYTLDGAATWTVVSPAGVSGARFLSVTFDPVTPQVVYTASMGGGPGVWKSTDGGATWSRVLVLAIGSQSLAVAPSSPLTVLTENFGGVAPFILRSVDGGASWANTTGVPTRVGSHGLAFDPTDALVAYASTSQGVYKSTTGGATWALSSSGLPTFPGGVGVTVDPSNPSTVYVGVNSGLAKTTDASASWTILQNGLKCGSTNSVIVDAVDPNVVYAAHRPLGIVRSVDGGDTWTSSNNGLTPADLLDVTQVAQDRTNPARFLAINQGSIFQSIDGATTWNPASSPIATFVNRVAIAPSNGDVAWALTAGDGAWVTTNGAASWSPVSSLPSGAPSAIAIDPTDSDTVWIADGLDIYRTTDGGSTWTPSTVINPILGGRVTALGVDPTAPNVVFSSVEPGLLAGIFRSIDGGASWSTVFGSVAREFVFEASVPSTVFAATSGGVFASRNQGSTWSELSTPAIPYFDFLTLAVGGGRLHAGITGLATWRRNITTCTTDAECDDTNECTTDACAPQAPNADFVGCVHSVVTCPAPGDCQTAACVVGSGCVTSSAPDATPCADDGTPCTRDLCRAGICAHEPNVLTCDVPLAAGAAAVSFGGADPGKAKLVWKWKKGSAIALADVGDPFTSGHSDYALCGFDRSGPGGAYALRFSLRAPAGGQCSGKACWAANTKTVKYKNKDRTPDGIDTLAVRFGDLGEAKLSLVAKGTHVLLPGTALLPDVRVQLRRDDAVAPCWEGRYSTAIRTNVPGIFKAKSDP